MKWRIEKAGERYKNGALQTVGAVFCKGREVTQIVVDSGVLDVADVKRRGRRACTAPEDNRRLIIVDNLGTTYHYEQWTHYANIVEEWRALQRLREYLQGVNNYEIEVQTAQGARQVGRHFRIQYRRAGKCES